MATLQPAHASQQTSFKREASRIARAPMRRTVGQPDATRSDAAGKENATVSSGTEQPAKGSRLQSSLLLRSRSMNDTVTKTARATKTTTAATPATRKTAVAAASTTSVRLPVHSRSKSAGVIIPAGVSPNSPALSARSSGSSGSSGSDSNSNGAKVTTSKKYANVKSRIGSLDNINHQAKGTGTKIFSEKPNFAQVKSRIGSLDNVKHKPKGGKVQVFEDKIDYSKVRSRVGSFDYIDRTPKGGDVKVFSEKTDYTKVGSRIGSLENINHQPKGGDKPIFSAPVKLDNVKSRVGSLDNINHQRQGGDVTIFSAPVKLDNVKSRVGSLDNINHQPQGGDVAIFSAPVKLDNVKSRVGSLDNINHQPQGGDVVIFHEKLEFRDGASARIDAGKKSGDSSVEDENRSAYSPVSAYSLDDTHELNSPESEQPKKPVAVMTLPIANAVTTVRNVLDPIAEANSEESDDAGSQLADTELKFEVNVQRRNETAAEPPKLERIVEVPHQLSTADQQAYDQSWI